MEEAVFISQVKNLKYVTKRYLRLYFGNEFCERLAPSSEDLSKIFEFILNRGLNFTLITPYLTNKGLKEWMPLIKSVLDKQKNTEIVVNDWGLLRLLNREYTDLSLVLGRLLTKQKIGPRIFSIMDKIPQIMIQHFRQSNIDVPVLSDFLINKGIRRVELDNPLQGITRRDPQLKGSLYIPFTYVTTTRFCPTATCENKVRSLRIIASCNKECQRYTFKLQHKQMPVDLLLKGNTQFFKNDRLPENLEALHIDRLVYQPEIPM